VIGGDPDEVIEQGPTAQRKKNGKKFCCRR
jgi:hypothetical protein